MKLSLWLPRLRQILWILFLLSLSVTSFPYFPSGLGGSTQVRPLALYPLIGLLLLVVLPRLLTKPLPRTLLPFFAFVAVALVATLISLTRGLDPDFGFTVADRALRNLITLGIGAAFYLAVALTPETPEDLRSTLRWLYAGFSVALFWGSLQVVYVFRFSSQYFQILKRLQRFISIRKLFPKRVSGMTYEPNWFAEQIAFLLMPWLFAAVISNYTVFRWRWRWITVELLLLAWATGVLIFTYSRSGVALLFLQLILAVFFWPRKKSPKTAWGVIARRILLVGVVVLILGVVIFAAGTQNNYFARLWSYFTSEEGTGEYLQYIAFSQRFTYWNTAFRIFEDHLLMGVGLGNFTFYFADYLPDQPLYPTPELLRKLTPEIGRDQTVTTKNLFVRILAETGLLGTAVFLSFLVALMGVGLYLWLSPQAGEQFWGRAAILGLVVFCVVAFSFDSLAIPNMWIVFGLVTAAGNVFLGQSSSRIPKETVRSVTSG
jgi:O-antigen ligase